MHSSASKNKKNEKGQGLVEYALILVLVAIVVIAALMILGPIIGNVFSKVNSSLSTVSSGGGAAAAAPANGNSQFCGMAGLSSGQQYTLGPAGFYMNNGTTFLAQGTYTCP